MDINDLKRAVAKKMSIRMTRHSSPDVSLHGFPLAYSREFWLLHDLREFHLDGYQVIPTRNIATHRFGKFERTFDQIARKEGITAQVGISYKIDLDSYAGLFASIRGAGKWAIAQTVAQIEKQREAERTFWIGPVVGISDHAVAIHSFDATGKWNRAPSTLAYDEIAEIAFDTEYINVWSRFIGKPPAAKRKMKRR